MEADPQRPVPLLSLCMIVRDEEHFLGECLQAVSPYVDEIVVVDTGSKDRTKAIAAGFSARLFDFEWVDDFALARNHALEQATGQWILVLDADELIEPRDLETIREMVATTPLDAFHLNQLNYCVPTADPGWIPVTQPGPFTRDYPGYRCNPNMRLFRNRPDIRFQGRVHETVDESVAPQQTGALDIPVHHYMNDNPERNWEQRQLNYLRIMETELASRPDGRLHASAGAVCMYVLKDYARALGHLEKAIALDYDRDKNREAAAEAHYRLNHLDQARSRYQSLFDEGYSSPTLYNNLANLLVRAEQHAGAIEVLQRALELGGTSPERRERLLHNINYLKGQLGAGD